MFIRYHLWSVVDFVEVSMKVLITFRGRRATRALNIFEIISIPLVGYRIKWQDSRLGKSLLCIWLWLNTKYLLLYDFVRPRFPGCVSLHCTVFDSPAMLWSQHSVNHVTLSFPINILNQIIKNLFIKSPSLYTRNVLNS